MTNRKEVFSVPDADNIAKLCLNFFKSKSNTGKPIEGIEWFVCNNLNNLYFNLHFNDFILHYIIRTVLCCIVKYNHSEDDLEVVSLGTGKTTY